MQNHSVTLAKGKIAEAKLPVAYDEACRALAECQNIDEAKYWDNKADALAAWAKIYRSDRAAIEARRLKLHAYRRMGEIAKELRKGGKKQDGTLAKGSPAFAGQLPGARSLLIEAGLSKSQAGYAVAMAGLERQKFDGYVSEASPPSPSRIVKVKGSPNPDWTVVRTHLHALRTELRKHDPADMGMSIKHEIRYGRIQAEAARELVDDVIEWLDRFERALPKG